MIWPANGTPFDVAYCTAHDADVPLAASGHCVSKKTPRPLLVKVTVPAGAVAVPGEMSLTVAVHWLRTGTTSWQLTFVLVTRNVTVICASSPLTSFPLSPP